jgi:hypothetical protein
MRLKMALDLHTSRTTDLILLVFILRLLRLHSTNGLVPLLQKQVTSSSGSSSAGGA